MIVLLKIGLIIALLLFLLRKKADLGLVLVLDSALTAVLFRMPVRAFLANAAKAVIASETLDLVAVVVLVLYIGNFLQRGGHFRRMVEALGNLVDDPRLILAIPSAFIGLLPMMAGAMMGAPIVDEAAKRWDLAPAWKTFYNYWFRHVWEYSWPLYINLILAAAILRVPITRISVAQFPFTLVAIAIGLVILFRRVPFLPKGHDNPKTLKDVFKVALSIWPILTAVILVFAFKLGMLAALGAASVLTQVFARMRLRERWAVVVESLSPKIILLTVAVMVFKRILETSGALDAVIRAVPPHGLSGYVLLFAAPFVVGLLTGVNQAFVAISFPLLVPIIGKGNPDMMLLAFAYVSGFVGILLSPAHLCLALTADYFKAPLKDVYKILVVPTLAVFLSALAALVISRLLS
jgi:integral membrane protein (TIGR00529 family)